MAPLEEKLLRKVTIGWRVELNTWQQDFRNNLHKGEDLEMSHQIIMKVNG